jgi:hypothetical protein
MRHHIDTVGSTELMYVGKRTSPRVLAESNEDAEEPAVSNIPGYFADISMSFFLSQHIDVEACNEKRRFGQIA